MDDEQIIKEATAWRQAENELRQDRRRYLRKTFLGGVSILGILTVLFSCVFFLPDACEARRESRQEEQSLEREKYEKYETTWKECLDTLGLEKCNTIEARFAHLCLATSNKTECLEDKEKSLSP